MKHSKITLIIPKQISKSITDDLFALGLRQLFTEVGRNSLLDKNISFSNFFSHRALVSYPVEIISFFTNAENENSVLSYIAKKYDLRMPGKGSIYSYETDILRQHPKYDIPHEIHFKDKNRDNFFRQLVGISCIVQRGEGDKLARISLNYGVSVPVSTYGEGSGARDKLGLLRITIPPEKEIINLLLSKHDANPVLELFISEGKLTEAGRGIAYVYPLTQGIVNTKISRNSTDQPASVEQMVSAIDSLKNGMEWRKSSLELGIPRRREYLTQLSELNLICEEGSGLDLIEAAMSSGAPGATVCKIRYSRLDENLEVRRYIREQCKMIVPTTQVPAITKALDETGCFSSNAHAFLYMLPVQKAYTYRAKQIRTKH